MTSPGILLLGRQETALHCNRIVHRARTAAKRRILAVNQSGRNGEWFKDSSRFCKQRTQPTLGVGICSAVE